jgi:manganese transport protein
MAIGVGNSAYQSGNLTGAGLGLRAAFGWPIDWVIGFATTVGAGLIIADRYILIERVLSALVMVMAVVFVGLAIILLPDFLEQPADRLIPVFTTQSTGACSSAYWYNSRAVQLILACECGAAPLARRSTRSSAL